MLHVTEVEGPSTMVQYFDNDGLAKRLLHHDVDVVREIFNTPLTGSDNYEIANSKIRRLYELGKRFDWNAELDINWGQALSAHAAAAAGEAPLMRGDQMIAA